MYIQMSTINLNQMTVHYNNIIIRRRALTIDIREDEKNTIFSFWTLIFLKTIVAWERKGFIASSVVALLYYLILSSLIIWFGRGIHRPLISNEFFIGRISVVDGRHTMHIYYSITYLLYSYWICMKEVDCSLWYVYKKN